MWQKFNEAARQVVLLGLEEATNLNCTQVRVEHFLLGLVREGGGMASQIFEGAGISSEKLRQEVESEVSCSSHGASQPQLSAEAKRILELSAREAWKRRHTSIGPEHIFLALLNEQNSGATQLLYRLGLDLEPIRAQVAECVGPENPAPLEETHSENNALMQKYLGAEIKAGQIIPLHLRELALRWTKANLEKEIAVRSNHYEFAAEFRQEAGELELSFAQQVQEWQKSNS